MEGGTNSYRVPCVVTVSRKTGKVIKTEYADATQEEFYEFCRWILLANGMETEANLIPRAKPKEPEEPEEAEEPNFHLMEI